MNREIKFRGRDKENWHYGDLVQEIRHNDNKLFDGTMTHIRNFEYKNGSYIGDIFPVNPNTIGQYTGFHDRFGNEIYESDIVYVSSEDENAIIEWDEETARFIIHFDGWIADFDNYYGEELEIMGDIYNNPELLGGD